MTLVYANVEKQQLDTLFNHGFSTSPTKSSYEVVRLYNDQLAATLILYTSKKLVIQHKQDSEEELISLLASCGLSGRSSSSSGTSIPKKEKTTTQFSDAHLNIPKEHIGTDEALKGDTFGGLVVAAFHMKAGDEVTLQELGVQDSKNLTDEKIIRLAQVLTVEFAERCVVEDVTPREYNETTAQVNVTALLDELHSTSAARLQDMNFSSTGERITHVIDQYPGCSVGDIKIEKGESHSLAIAAASILARAKGLEQFGMMSAAAGFKLPLGSTHVKEALARLKAENKELINFAKLHFKNVKEFM